MAARKRDTLPPNWALRALFSPKQGTYRHIFRLKRKYTDVPIGLAEYVPRVIGAANPSGQPNTLGACRETEFDPGRSRFGYCGIRRGGGLRRTARRQGTGKGVRSGSPLPPPQCHGVADPNVLALGDWSEPVANKYGLKLRGRLSICEYPEHRGHSGTDTALYVELQEYSDFVGAIGEVFWAPESLSCELTDGSGKAVPCSGGAYGGPTPPASWIKLPSNSSLRLRVSPYGGGKLTDGGFDLWANLPQTWTLEPKDTNAYFLSGVLTIKSPNDYKPTDFQWVWTGTLKLPKMKLSLETLRGVKQESPPAGAADEIAAKEPAKASTAGRYAPSPQNHASLRAVRQRRHFLERPQDGDGLLCRKRWPPPRRTRQRRPHGLDHRRNRRGRRPAAARSEPGHPQPDALRGWAGTSSVAEKIM